MAQPPEDEPFLARWSKRKRAEQEEPAPEPEPEPSLPPQDDDSISQDELAALPSIDEFTPQTDIRAFLRKGVPKPLQNAALRKMWMLTPSIRDHNDPAVDYAWDWNTPGGVPGDGAAPTAERAAQMLRDLFHPCRAAEDENTLETDGIPPVEPAAKPAVSAAQNRPVSASEDVVAQPSGDSARPDLTTNKVKENQSTNAGAMPRRRHGGALPS